ncbi:hypothetical protein EIP86_006356 [Pleurotus ostreatoroseus]|nr:hypothetical protein EIP86_006356 [Pleurotus ostreatoroseus]
MPNICKTNTGILCRVLHVPASRCRELRAVPAQVDFLTLSDDYLHLPASGQTRRSFHQIAMPILWRTIYGLGPLLKCFPEDIWSPKQTEILDLEGPLRMPLHSEWEPFHLYAKHIKTLNLSQERYGYDYDKALRFLSIHRPVLQLFPNLHTIYISATLWDHKADFTRLFFSSSVRTVHVRCSYEDMGLAGVIEALSDSAPALEELSIITGRMSPSHLSSAIVAFETFGLRLKNLISLSCTTIPLSEKNVHLLALLPNLAHLNCAITPADQPPSLIHENGSVVFRSLTTLQIGVKELSPSMIALFNGAGMPKLEELCLKLRAYPLAADFKSLFSALSTHLTLHCLAITIQKRGYEETEYTITDDILEPLLCRDIRKLKLSDCVCELDDLSLERMESAWPCIEQLWIGNLGLTEGTKITYQALYKFATRCTQLHDFGIPMDSHSLGRKDLLAPKPAPCTSLKTLRVSQGASISDHVLFAAVTSAMFPSVKIVPGSSTRAEQQLNDVLDILRMVRAQEYLLPSTLVSFFGSHTSIGSLTYFMT